MEELVGCISGGVGDVSGNDYCYDPNCTKTDFIYESCGLDCPVFTGDRYKRTTDNENCICDFGMSLNDTDGYCWRDCASNVIYHSATHTSNT
jgi:hypothetical protein